MSTEQPRATLYRRLGAQPGPIADADDGDDPDEADEDIDAAIPGWVPDGRPTAGQAWLSAIRADPGRAGGAALATIAVLAVLITVFTLIRQRPEPVVSANLPSVEAVPSSLLSFAPSTSPPSVPPTPPAKQPMVVSVVGLVQQPGLVTVTPNARVADAVAAAGGTLRGADTLGLNLARHLADGEQIVVGVATPAGQPPPGAPAKTVAPVDLNSASVEELDALPGVGPVTAAAIVAWRSANGRFTSVDQLGEVDGIGPTRLEKLRPLVRV